MNELSKQILEVAQGLAEQDKLAGTSHKPIQVMLVEDNADDAALIMLEIHGLYVTVTWFKTGEDAVAALDDGKQYDIALIDLILARMTGVDVLEHIRQLTPKMPVVIVTGYPLHPLVARAAKLGYIGLITKPIREGEMEDIMKKHKLL